MNEINEFNPTELAKRLKEQAVELVPEDLTEEQKEGLVEALYNYTQIAGNALIEREEDCFDADVCEIISQIIAEWTFHKYVDLCRAGVPAEYFDAILQKINYEIFELATDSAISGVSQDEMLKQIEYLVKNTYKRSLAKLRKKNLISSDSNDKGFFLSNIDKMATEIKEKEEDENLKRKLTFFKVLCQFEFFVFLYSLALGFYAYVFKLGDFTISKSCCVLAIVALISLVEKIANKKYY